MKKIFFCFGVISFSLLIFQATPNFADASAWWGTGARDKDWILKRGGTLIRYEIKNTKKSDDIVARMYLLGATGAGGGASQKAKAGDLIETESGKSATFDDAINNEYEIKIFQNEKLKLSTKVVARPGEILKLTFNLKNDSVKKQVRVVYSQNEIIPNDKSAKYVKPVASQKTRLNKVEKKPETSPEQKNEKEEQESLPVEGFENEEFQLSVEQETLEKSLFVIENEIEPLKLKIERNFEKANRKNFLAYVFLGPDKKEIEKIESKLVEVYEKITIVDEMKKSLPINDVRFELEGRRNFWENFLENKKIALEKSRSDLKFWNRISSLLKTQSTFETRIESV
jgi:hypothetical protein